MIHVFHVLRYKTLTLQQEATRQKWNRVTGSAILVWSGHGSVCQTQCLSRFWVLTCAFIVALQS